MAKRNMSEFREDDPSYFTKGSGKHEPLRFTPVGLRTADYYPGPCYVLDPEAWMRGHRVVLEVIPAPELPERARRRDPEPVPATGETRRIVRWTPGDPLSWELVDVPVMRREPAWAARARELRANGWSLRRIAKELGVSENRHLRRILKTTV